MNNKLWEELKVLFPLTVVFYTARTAETIDIYTF